MMKYNLNIRCSNLPNNDYFSKSDPFVVMSEKSAKNYIQKGNTESIKNDNNPDFQRRIVVEAHPNMDKILKFEIFDKDKESRKLKDHEFMGHAEVSLREILSGAGNKPLIDPYTGKHLKCLNSTSIIYITAEPYTPSQYIYDVQFRGVKLAKKDLFSSDPFIEILKNNGGKWVCVFKTEVKTKNLNPVWNRAKIESFVLCENDESKNLLLRCYDWDKNSQNDLIGECYLSARDMQSGASFVLYKSAGESGKKQGTIELLNFTRTMNPEFSYWQQQQQYQNMQGYNQMPPHQMQQGYAQFPQQPMGNQPQQPQGFGQFPQGSNTYPMSSQQNQVPMQGFQPGQYPQSGPTHPGQYPPSGPTHPGQYPPSGPTQHGQYPPSGPTQHGQYPPSGPTQHGQYPTQHQPGMQGQGYSANQSYPPKH